VDDGALGIPGISPNQSSLQLTVDSGSNSPAAAGMAFSAYVAPVDFVRVASAATDSTISLRSIAVKVVSQLNPTVNATVNVTIVRPPIVLVHGTWSNPDTWLNFTPLNPLNPDPRFDVFPVDYSGTETAGVTSNAPLVLDQIRYNLDRFKALSNVAAVQSDLVAHSLGGLISRALVLVPNFFYPGNFGRGEVHKLITIDSTHLGTPLANNLLASNPVCRALWAAIKKPIGNQIIDQAEGSNLLTLLNSISAPIHLRAHVIVGHANSGQEADAEDAFFTNVIQSFCPSLLPPGGFTELYLPNNAAGGNDIIVGAASQAGVSKVGVPLMSLSASNPAPVTEYFSLVHTVAPIIPTGPDVLNRMWMTGGLNVIGTAVQAPQTVPTVAEVVRLLNSSVTSIDYAEIKP
jgi:pimeloyl-ACP methyl ester carboxylesterase